MPVIEIGGRKFKVKKIRMSWIIHDDFVEYEVFSNDTFIFKMVINDFTYSSQGNTAFYDSNGDLFYEAGQQYGYDIANILEN